MTALEAQASGKVLPGRQTTDQPSAWFQQTALDQRRRGLGQDEDTISAIKAVRDLDSQASHAVWNFLRLINPGHTLKAYTAAADGSETLEDGPGQQLLNDLAERVGADYGGGLDQLHNVLGLVLITTGAACIEVEFNSDLTDVVDWHPVDPPLMMFQRTKDNPDDPNSGWHQQLGQQVEAAWAPVNEGQVFYQPLDPDIDDPYGRPPMVAAVQNIVWLSQLLADVRAMAHQQGFPRLDVAVVWDAIQNAAPPSVKDDASAFQQWATEQLSSIVSDYENLAADDTFIHYDFVKVGTAGGAAGSFDFSALNAILQRRITMALKALPITLGINDSTSETHGSIQWQIQVAGIENFQKIIKRLVERAANLCLQFHGIQAHAKVEYEEIRTIDRLYEAQSDFFDRRNAQFDVQMGWATNDEASERIVGHPAVSAPLIALSGGVAGNTSGGGGGPMGGGNQPAPQDTNYQMPTWWTNLFGNDPNNPQLQTPGENPGAGTQPASLPGSTADPTMAWKLMTEAVGERMVAAPDALPFEKPKPTIRSTTVLRMLRQARQPSET